MRLREVLGRGSDARTPLRVRCSEALKLHMNFDLSAYDHLLLDMNGTFLFDFDRFGPEQDFGGTYVKTGFTSLAAEEAQRRVRAAYDYLAVRYIDEAYYHAFPSVAQAVRATSPRVLPEAVVHELVDTFAAHELGVLPKGHKEALAKLSALRPLSVLSNLWAPKQRWLECFDEWGITDYFTCLHFSSDGPEMKPHPAFFERALQSIHTATPGARVLYIGDSYRCDVLGAVAAGLDAVWLAGDKPRLTTCGQPVATYADLLGFAEAVKI